MSLNINGKRDYIQRPLAINYLSIPKDAASFEDTQWVVNLFARTGNKPATFLELQEVFDRMRPQKKLFSSIVTSVHKKTRDLQCGILHDDVNTVCQSPGHHLVCLKRTEFPDANNKIKSTIVAYIDNSLLSIFNENGTDQFYPGMKIHTRGTMQPLSKPPTEETLNAGRKRKIRAEEGKKTTTTTSPVKQTTTNGNSKKARLDDDFSDEMMDPLQLQPSPASTSSTQSPEAARLPNKGKGKEVVPTSPSSEFSIPSVNNDEFSFEFDALESFDAAINGNNVETGDGGDDDHGNVGNGGNVTTVYHQTHHQTQSTFPAVNNHQITPSNVLYVNTVSNNFAIDGMNGTVGATLDFLDSLDEFLNVESGGSNLLPLFLEDDMSFNVNNINNTSKGNSVEMHQNHFADLGGLQDFDYLENYSCLHKEFPSLMHGTGMHGQIEYQSFNQQQPQQQMQQYQTMQYQNQQYATNSQQQQHQQPQQNHFGNDRNNFYNDTNDYNNNGMQNQNGCGNTMDNVFLGSYNSEFY